MTPEVRKQIEEGVKEIAKKSTAPDKETPDWMETDIRRGAEFGYQLACKSSHPEQGEQMAQDIMNILREHSTFVDGQIKALIVHGAIEKIVEYINGKLSSPPPEGQNERFTVEEIKNYLLSQDSRGDIMYNLSAENIKTANNGK